MQNCSQTNLLPVLQILYTLYLLKLRKVKRNVRHIVISAKPYFKDFNIFTENAVTGNLLDRSSPPVKELFTDWHVQDRKYPLPLGIHQSLKWTPGWYRLGQDQFSLRPTNNTQRSELENLKKSNDAGIEPTVE